MALEKVGVESTHMDTGKQTSKIVAPLIIKQSLRSESEINIDNCVQFN
jgi:hypothetical protein